MDGNFSDQLKTVLSDPDAMSTIATLAKKFASHSPTGEKAAQNGENRREAFPPTAVLGELMDQPAISSALKYLGEGSSERMALLQAMRPFVKDEKKEKLDRIVQTMQMLDLLISARKLL